MIFWLSRSWYIVVLLKTRSRQGIARIHGHVRHKLGFIPSIFFSALQSYCSRLSVVFLSYESSSTLIRLDRRKKNGRDPHAELTIRCAQLPYLSILTPAGEEMAPVRLRELGYGYRSSLFHPSNFFSAIQLYLSRTRANRLINESNTPTDLVCHCSSKT